MKKIVTMELIHSREDANDEVYKTWAVFKGISDGKIKPFTDGVIRQVICIRHNHYKGLN